MVDLEFKPSSCVIYLSKEEGKKKKGIKGCKNGQTAEGT